MFSETAKLEICLIKNMLQMAIMYIMIGLSLSMSIGFVIAFIWSVKSGQQDDLTTPAMRILMDENKTKTRNL
jgi:cbb3-type cytochrome oxidase maturation protein